MSSYHNVSTSDLGFWSYVPPQEQNITTILTETAGIAQPVQEIDLGGPITAIGWDFAATLQTPSHEGITFGNIEPADPAAFNPACYFSDSHPNIAFLDPWFTPTPSLTDRDPTNTSPNGVPIILQSRSKTATAEHDVPVLRGPFTPTITSPAALAWIFSPGPFMRHSYTPADGSATGPIAPEYGTDFFDISGPASNPSFLGDWGEPGCFVPSPSAATPLAPSIFASSQMDLDKGHRREDDNLEDWGEEIYHGHLPSLREKGKVQMEIKPWVLEAGGSTSTTHLSPVTGTHTGNHLELLKAASGEAERLTALYAQGGSKGLLQGPSVQQGSTGAIAQEQPPSVEGNEEAATQYQINNTIPQKETTVHNAENSKPEKAQGNLFYISRRLDKRYRALLEASSDDWARGAIHVLKCRLCPGAGFSNWADFKRHCREMEAHPARILFCDRCGDFFARGDSLKRHRKLRPPECREVSPIMAETKRKETKKAHKEFKERLKQCLKTGESIGRPFAQVIREMYPRSSKRGSRQQNRLQKSRSRA